ncbi:MAG TPA: hypothetical protein VMD07_02795 [Candidatus Acidoferrales bacterium]|nr:hypothetical protein [Candidatus Acidoferrales bacterium]
MARRIVAIVFVLAAFAPQTFAGAQQSTHATRTSHTTTASKSTASAHHSSSNAKHGHRSNPWANSVYVNGGTAAQYLATSRPKPPPKNKVNTGSGQEVFKSISN